MDDAIAIALEGVSRSPAPARAVAMKATARAVWIGRVRRGTACWNLYHLAEIFVTA